MERMNSFMSALNAQHENFKAECVNVDSLVKNIEFYEAYIPDFFSKYGEAQGIKDMYNGIKQNLGSEKSIICADINQGSYIYKEYMEGMITFINDIANTVITESCDELKQYEEKFEKAKEKDSMFIESLYNGNLNQKTEMVLSEAVANIEFLIDFIPELQSMKSRCLSLCESFRDEAEGNKKTLLNESLNMLYESVDNYCYSTLSNIIKVYDDIHESLFNNVQPVKQETTPQFRLF